ncbi:MAG: hypothetical protein ABIQ79_09655 [Nitrospiraceae bacterium]
MSDPKWTTEKPTKPGWYWYRRVFRDTVDEAECVRLREAITSELQDDRLYMRSLPQDIRRVDWGMLDVDVQRGQVTLYGEVLTERGDCQLDRKHRSWSEGVGRPHHHR